jgi:hypothetical protein
LDGSSSPIGPFVFLAGKLLGVLAAVSASAYLFLLALLFAARIGPPESVHDPADWPAITAAALAFVLAAAIGAGRSFRSGQPFGLAAIKAACATFTVGFVLTLLLDRGWHWRPFAQLPDLLLVEAAILALLGAFLLASISALLAVLLGRGAFLGTVVVFMAGLAWERGSAFALLPDLQVFWVGEVFYKIGGALPVHYLGFAVLYAATYSVACLAASGWILERREG